MSFRRVNADASGRIISLCRFEARVSMAMRAVRGRRIRLFMCCILIVLWRRCEGGLFPYMMDIWEARFRRFLGSMAFGRGVRYPEGPNNGYEVGRSIDCINKTGLEGKVRVVC